jgi:hypothetical protein
LARQALPCHRAKSGISLPHVMSARAGTNARVERCLPRFHPEQERPRGHAEAAKDEMKHQAQHQAAKASAAATAKGPHRKPAQPWRPKPTGLTREEIRAIVMEMIG